MYFDIVQTHCLNKPLVTEGFPFDNQTIVWKVAGKMFCLANINSFISLNLKCNPDKAKELREEYPQITPGYHMNKTLWNTVLLDGLSEKFIFELIDHSYEEVVQKLPKKIKEQIKA